LNVFRPAPPGIVVNIQCGPQTPDVPEHRGRFVIYDAFERGERVFLMSAPDDDHPFWYRIRGMRATAIRDRYEALWDEAAELVTDQ
jgi:hypothetical protein